MKLLATFITALAFAGFAGSALAADHSHSTLGVSGYDLVSYHKGGPVKGSGYHVSEHDGVTYLFASKENKASFDKNPDKYLPAYGGWCAFGVSVGKKFHSDPLAWRVVNGKLYLNLDADIQSKWLEDVPGRIKTADAKWPGIRDKAASEL